MAKNKSDEVVIINRIEKKVFRLKVVGETGLLMHKFSDKIMGQMLAAQMAAGKKPKAKTPKNPIQDFLRAVHFLEPGKVDIEKIAKAMEDGGVKPGDDVTEYMKGCRVGFPAGGFKKACIATCRQIDVTMAEMRGKFFIVADSQITNLVEIKYDKVYLAEHPVRLNGKTADIRHRPLFYPWSADLSVKFRTDAITMESIANIVDQAGFSVGVGDWRPDKDGEHGMFEVVTG